MTIRFRSTLPPPLAGEGAPERGAGSAQRGAGTRLRDATVELIVWRVVPMPILCASTGSRPSRELCSALRCAPLAGCDREGAHEHADFRRRHPVAGDGGTRSRGPTCRDATVKPAICASLPSLRASSRSDPRGSLFRATTRASIGKLIEPALPSAGVGGEGRAV
jgi:hypothetical protein